ncbi:MAG: hypothetical protein KGJ07_09775, partial [Patescibacteria group bacterium]|nr:hypothetical protein [Patescibacteria group bacterium]
MDKTNVILGGTYCVVVLALISVFVISPTRSDVSNQLTQMNLFDQAIMKNTQLSVADLFAKSDQGVVQIIVSKTNDSSVERD